MLPSPRREIGRVADDGLLLRGPLADEIADHVASFATTSAISRPALVARSASSS